jgi:hypothetical protein
VIGRSRCISCILRQTREFITRVQPETKLCVILSADAKGACSSLSYLHAFVSTNSTEKFLVEFRICDFVKRIEISQLCQKWTGSRHFTPKLSYIYDLLPLLVSRLGQRFLCEVRDEAEETVDDLNTSNAIDFKSQDLRDEMREMRHLDVYHISIIIDIKRGYSKEKPYCVCYVERGRAHLRHRDSSLFLETVQEFQILLRAVTQRMCRTCQHRVAIS